MPTFIHNTSYSSSIGCCTGSIFHGREPTKPLDLRFSTKAMETVTAESDFVTAMQDAMLVNFKETKNNLISAYQKYRGYYDQKEPLKLNSVCLLLNLLLTIQSDFADFSNRFYYIICKMETNYTQCVHRICIRPVVPQH